MNAYVALLRGINVGGRNTVPMAELRTLMSDLEYAKVATYVQSGNVLFQSDKTEQQVCDEVAAAIGTTFGLSIRVIVRSAAEMRSTVDRFPYTDPEMKRLYVVFLDAVPHPDRVSALDPPRYAPDEVMVDGREVFLHIVATTYGETKLTNAFLEKALGVAATTRNLNTTMKLAELAVGLSKPE